MLYAPGYLIKLQICNCNSMSGILKQVFTQSWLIALSNKHFLTLSVAVDLGGVGCSGYFEKTFWWSVRVKQSNTQ